MSGLFSQVFSLGAEPVYPGNEFSFSSSYSRGKQSMSSCVLQQLLANKTVLVQFFSGSLASKFEMTQILFVPRSCGLSFASRLMLAVVSRFFNTVLLYLAWNSFSSASNTLFSILDELQSPETAFTNSPLIVFYQWKLYCCLEYCVQGAQQYRGPARVNSDKRHDPKSSDRA